MPKQHVHHWLINDTGDHGKCKGCKQERDFAGHVIDGNNFRHTPEVNKIIAANKADLAWDTHWSTLAMKETKGGKE